MNSGSFLINSDFQSSIEHPSRVQNELVMLQEGLKISLLVSPYGEVRYNAIQSSNSNQIEE